MRRCLFFCSVCSMASPRLLGAVTVDQRAVARRDVLLGGLWSISTPSPPRRVIACPRSTPSTRPFV